ncbi:unnamed protein product [Auanema sp. JU1783]|nr:unnamed protein product [Auanema sp. JU1783]
MLKRLEVARLVSYRWSSNEAQRSFDVDLVSLNYAKRTEWAAANFGNSGEPYRMVLPPPNVTGKLHIGHALTVAVEDSICRHQRIQGKTAVWTPGFDHAGIATQSVFAKDLWKRERKLLSDLSREEFLAKCSDFSMKNADVISTQLKRMGATLDWDNSYYTMNEKFSSAVTKAFMILYNEKLIKRDKRIVQWCPMLQSSLSDQEVERVDINADQSLTVKASDGTTRVVEVGVMHKIKYPLADSLDTFLEVGTTRPETIFADVALAVHPRDNRYSKFIGKLVKHPILSDRVLPVISDESVKPEKGTGVVKITPYHDALDYEIASRHWKEILQVDPSSSNRHCVNDNGKLINVPSDYHDLDRFDARKKIVQNLSSISLYGGVIKHDSAQVSICSRTGDIIEPRLTEQWFLDTRDMHNELESDLRRGLIKVTPGFHEQRLMDWLSNVEPWCLSRQILWGHRIPAFTSNGSNWTVAENIEKAKQILNSDDVRQDSDVLDTWFSSSLVPLVTTGWMEGQTYNNVPLHIMETGWDILGFWVVRMLILTKKLTNQNAFPQVVLHGLIRDSNGRKMSKSLGNVIDPLDVLDGITKEEMILRLKSSSLLEKEIETGISEIERKHPEGIPKYGADALRFALFKHDVLSMDIPINISETAGEGYRFCNKLWNLIQYAESVNEKCKSSREYDSDHPADLWILSRLASTLSETDDHMSNFSPHSAFNTLYRFILTNICDVYLESTKKDIWSDNTLRHEEIRTTLTRVLQPTLVQLSVFLPFVSEHLYERLFNREKGSIYFDFVKASYFQLHRDDDLENQMNLALSVVSSARSVRQQLNLPNKLVFDAILFTGRRDMNMMKNVISDLGNVNIVKICDKDNAIPQGYMPSCLAGFDDRIALRIEKEHESEFMARLTRVLEKAEERKKSFESKSRKYEEIVLRDEKEGKVKQNVIEKSRRKASQAKNAASSAATEAEKIRALLEDLKHS